MNDEMYNVFVLWMLCIVVKMIFWIEPPKCILHYINLNILIAIQDGVINFIEFGLYYDLISLDDCNTFLNRIITKIIRDNTRNVNTKDLVIVGIRLCDVMLMNLDENNNH